MTINRFNYESYLVDYLDGKLNPSFTAELLLFLDKNPDIKGELDGIQDAVLVGELTVYPNKSALKKKSFLKDGIDDEFDYLCIASIEGVLSQEEKNTFERILKDGPDRQNEFLTFQKAKIDADSAISYPNKSILKRSTIIPIRYSTLRLSISIAATITLIVGIYSIGRLMVSSNPLVNSSISSIAESTFSTAKRSTEEVKSKEVPVYETPTTRKTEQLATENTIQESAKPKKSRVNIEESIPNFVRRIDLKETDTPKGQEYKQLAQIAAKYAPKNQIFIDQLYAQQTKSDTKELGVFEVIQYGVKSFGKLIGSDINLNADKDQKGNIEKINFDSNLIAFSTPVRKNE